MFVEGKKFKIRNYEGIRHIGHDFEFKEITPQGLKDIYDKIYGELGSPEHVAFVITQESILLFVRSQSHSEGIGINSAGFFGMFVIKDEEIYKKLCDGAIDCYQIIKEVTEAE